MRYGGERQGRRRRGGIRIMWDLLLVFIGGMLIGVVITVVYVGACGEQS